MPSILETRRAGGGVLFANRHFDGHKDPFDRMLICQAIIGGLTLLTPDPLVSQYPVATAW